jgi:hypothetical protein
VKEEYTHNQACFSGGKETPEMSSNYQTVTGDVLSVIKHLGEQKAALELTQSYKEVVLKQAVKILEVNPEYATFRASNIGMCAALNDDVYLHSQSFPKPVMARLKGLSIGEGMFVLSDFSYQDAEWKERQHERVRPKDPIYVTLQWRQKAIRACIENISVNGMGILAYKLVEKGIKIRPGSTIYMDFNLPPHYKYSGVKGTVIYLNAIGDHSVKLGVQLHPKTGETHSLGNYFAQRKQEILDELDQLFSESYWQRGVQHLYF